MSISGTGRYGVTVTRAGPKYRLSNLPRSIIALGLPSTVLGQTDCRLCHHIFENQGYFDKNWKMIVFYKLEKEISDFGEMFSIFFVIFMENIS